ncbi:CVNH domain-containing protein [Xylogone sp. PMI_703]|nr:CVNH domain-containing protein [Xylogone sp. PMI_703]
MSFHLTSEDIRIENNHILKANLRDADGNLHESEIDLNQFIGNENGHFQWQGERFSESAKDVTFSIEGGGQVPVLRAILFDVDGGEHARDINLAERIENIDGRFQFDEAGMSYYVERIVNEYNDARYQAEY